MDSPITRAFGLPELALHLEPLLFPRDVVNLMQTCRTLYSTFLPCYAQKAADFSTLCLLLDRPQTSHSLSDVAINAFHLRTIMLDGGSCREYHDEFREFYPPPTPSSSSSTSSSSVNPTLDPPSSSQLIYQPPLAFLNGERSLPYQTRYFLQGSPRLTSLHLHNIGIENDFTIKHWAPTISAVEMLETLYLDFKVHSAYSVVHVIPTIFADCPRSLKSVTLRSYGSRGLHVLYARVDPAIDDPFFNVPALTNKNNNNLPNPTEWQAIIPSPSFYSFTPFLEMLFHCQNLVPMDSRPSRLDGSSSLPSPSPSSSLVVRLFVAGSSDDRHPGNMTIPHLKIIQRMCAEIFSAMMGVLQENTLETVKLTRYNGMEEGDMEEIKDEEVKKTDPMDTVELVPWTKTVITDEGTRVVVVPRTSPRVERKPSMRHFESLRRFEMNKCRRLDSILLQKVLFDCLRLEIFNALATPVRLEDVTEEAWASTGIQELYITINSSMIRIPVGSNNRSELDQQQKEKMERLEILYQQLGRLTELKILDTRRYVKRPAPNVNFRSVLSTSEYFLPGLLTVGDSCAEAGGQWGGLQLLSGLKNLTTLRGQFHANITTMPGFILGEKEVAWITANWPRLEKVEFYTGDYAVDSPEVSSSVEWLQTKLPHVEFLPFNY